MRGNLTRSNSDVNRVNVTIVWKVLSTLSSLGNFYLSMARIRDISSCRPGEAAYVVGVPLLENPMVNAARAPPAIVASSNPVRVMCTFPKVTLGSFM